MRAFILSIILLYPILAIGQSVFTMPDKSKEPQEAVIKYDSLHNIRFGSTDKIKYLNDFEQYIGQEIIFYDFGANLKDKAEGYINFEAEPTIVKCDTVWLKRKKKVKPEHYTIDTMYSRKYKPLYFEGNNIKDCSSLISIYSEHSFEWDNWKPFTGYATPICDINNQKFTIVDFNSKHSGTNLYITLTDKDNNKLFWIVESFEMYKRISDWNNGNLCWPVITKGFMDKMIQKYSNEEFFFIRNNIVYQFDNKNLIDKTIALNTSGEKCQLLPKVKYKFTDLVYVDLYETYSVPCFLVKDSIENKFFIPLCRMPKYSTYSQNKVYEPEKEHNERWAYMEDLTFKSADIVYEEQRLEQQRIDEVQKQRALERAKEQTRIAAAQKQKEIDAAVRKVALTKKYGSEIATLIVGGKVRIGMTDEMCRESWGNPSDINRSTGVWGVHEQWVYYGNNYLYFENGKLTSIQN